MSAPNTFVLSAAGAGTGIYTGTFPGGASGGMAGMYVTISGFTKAANNGTFLITDSSATTITTTNAASLAETHAGTATDFTSYVVLDGAGRPESVVAVATATGRQFSKRFCTVCKPDGSSRNLWLQLVNIVGAVSAFAVTVLESFDGGMTWGVLQTGIDLFNSPVQQVSPKPSTGGILMVQVDTLTGGTSADVLASSS